MSSEDGLTPLLAIRAKLDHGIESYKDKIAILNKRRSVIQQAIDVLRSSDTEIEALLEESGTIHAKNGQPKNYRARIDEVALECAVLKILAESQRSWAKAEIANRLAGDNVPHTMYILKRVLLTSPKVQKSGERDFTVYSYTG